MAKLCTSCGNPLPREDSHFCNNCGAAFSNASTSAVSRPTKVISDENRSAPAHSGMREQIAFAAPPRPVPSETPAWMSNLDTMGNRAIGRPRLTYQRTATSPKEGNPPSNVSAPLRQAGSPLPPRELRIKVWDDAETGDHDEPSDQQQSATGDSQVGWKEEEEVQSMQDTMQALPDAEGEVEDLPTTPLLSTVDPEQGQKPAPLEVRQEQPVDGNGRLNTEERGDADLPTRPLPTSIPAQNPAPARRPAGRPFPAQSYRQSAFLQPPPGHTMEQRQEPSAQTGPKQPPVVQRPVIPALPVSHPGFQQAVPLPASVAKEKAAKPSRPARRASRMRIVIVLVLLVILAAGGLIYWIVEFQPFSVPAVTQTSLAYQNTSLGIAVEYPQGWTAKLDSSHSTVAFFDTNHTDQVNIVVAASNGSSVAAYVKKEVAQLGLTAQKNLSPFTFAGTSWQQVQGSVLVSGATYTETLLVAMHGDHFYSFVQMAPAATYGDADHLFFTILRSSWRFL